MSIHGDTAKNKQKQTIPNDSNGLSATVVLYGLLVFLTIHNVIAQSMQLATSWMVLESIT